MNAAKPIINALSGTGNVFDSFNTTHDSLTVGANNGSGTFSGFLASPLAFIKSGTGTQTLTGSLLALRAITVNQRHLTPGTGTASTVSVTNFLTLSGNTSPTAKLDLTNSDLIVNSDSTNSATVLSTITQQITAAKNGTDANGYDVAYDGNGTGNCFSMTGVTSMFPADGSTFPCAATNAFSSSVQTTMASWIGANALTAWKQHPHPAKPGFTPLEIFP